MSTDTTPAPIGADALREALKWAAAALQAIASDEDTVRDKATGETLSVGQILDAADAALASAAQPAADDITASEAVFAFAAWLTCRSEAVTLGSAHDAAGAAELVGAFVASQGLAQPRDDFHQRLRPYPAAAPKAAPTQPADKYPPLPTPDLGMPWRVNAKSDGAAHSSGFTDSQMRAYVDADRAARAQEGPAAGAGPVVAYRISDPNEPDLGHWLSEEPGAAWCKSEPLRSAAPTTQAAPAAQGDAMAKAWEQSAADIARQAESSPGDHYWNGVAEGLRTCARDLLAARAAKEGA